MRLVEVFSYEYILQRSNSITAKGEKDARVRGQLLALAFVGGSAKLLTYLMQAIAYYFYFCSGRRSLI